MRSFVGLVILILVFQAGAVFHKNARTTQVHSPFRWVFADSAAMATESVTADDTDKVAYRVSDSSMWVLRDNSPKTWIKIADGSAVPDSLNAILGRFDSVGVRVISADSVKFGNAGFIRCDTGSFACTTSVTGGCHSGDGFGSPTDTVGIAHWFRYGKMVSIYFEGFQFIVSGTSATNIDVLNFPDSLVPNNSYSGILDFSVIPAGNSGSGMCLILNNQSCNAALFFHANSVRTYSVTNFYVSYFLTDVSSR